MLLLYEPVFVTGDERGCVFPKATEGSWTLSHERSLAAPSKKKNRNGLSLEVNFTRSSVNREKNFALLKKLPATD